MPPVEDDALRHGDTEGGSSALVKIEDDPGSHLAAAIDRDDVDPSRHKTRAALAKIAATVPSDHQALAAALVLLLDHDRPDVVHAPAAFAEARLVGVAEDPERLREVLTSREVQTSDAAYQDAFARLAAREAVRSTA